jgi:tetratricopeptide (TPR) repeat protein
MNKEGQLDRNPLAELIREAQSTNLSGALRLTRERAKAAIYFDDGNVVFATSNLRTHRLCEVLLRDNVNLQLENYPPQASDAELSQALLNNGQLTLSTLTLARKNQVADVLRVALLWTDGEWEFDPRVRLAEDVRVPVEVNRLLLECARHLPSQFVSARLVGSNGGSIITPSGATITNLLPAEAFVLSRVSEPLTLAELISISGVGEEESGRAIYALTLAGCLDRSDWPEAFSGAQPQSAPKKQPVAAAKKPDTIGKRDELADVEQFMTQLDAARDYYDVLGIARLAEAAEIKRVYHALALRFHPDRFHKSDSTLRARIDSAFARLSQAYEVLSDPTSRASYDAKMMKSRQGAPPRSPDSPNTRVPSAQSTDPQRAEGQFQRGMKALQLNRRDEGIRLLSEAVLLQPREARYRANYGRALIAQPGTQRIAEAELKAALALDPENASYRVMLAELYKQMGLHRRAEGELERVLVAHPQHETARALLSSLKKKM